MNHLLKRSLSLIMAILMVLAMIPANTVFAAEPEGTTDETVTVTENTTSAAVLLEEESTTVVNYDFTDATANEAGEGFAWNNDSKTLTLSGVAITEAVVLPAGSTIVVTEGTENSIKVASGDAVSSEGSLAITGAGKLTVVTADASAVVAPSVSITDTVVDLHGYFYGIQAKTTTGTADSVVTLTNVSGKIGGYGYGGINAHSETANIEVKLNRCYDLEMYNEVTNDSTSVNFNFAGIRAYTRGSGKDVLVELNNCQNVSISNSTMAILAANNANAANAEAANVKVLVQNSTGIELTGNTSCYSAVFVNNYGVENDDSSNLVIENSTVEVNAPNGSGLMTSTKSAPSEVDVSSSTITVTAGATGIRTIASSAEYADTDVTGSNITFKGNLTGNPVDVSAGGVVTDEAYADDASTVTVVMPATTYEVGTKAELDAAIAAAKDGDTIKLINDVVFDDVADIEARPAASNGNGKYCGFNYGNGAFVNVIGGNVTIDLNGHSITYDLHHEEWCNKRVVSIFYVTDKANLTVTDSVGTGAVTVYGMGTAAYSVAVDSKITIEGGTWTWNPCKTCGATNAFLYASHGGEMYIKGGKFVNNVDGESGDYMIFSHYSSKETTENSAGVDYDSTKIEISGGTFDGYNPSQIKYVDQGNGNAEKKDDGCAPNFVPTENADGTYSVIEMCLEGSGTAEDPYLISSVEEFIFFAKQTQNGNSYSGKIIKLANDIDFNGANILEIAEDGTVVTDYRIPKFSGTFDGNGKTIKNFNFVVKGAFKGNIMLFSQENMWAYIRNLNIENVSVSVADITGETRISALANRVNAGGMTDAAIKNVHIKNFTVNSTNTTTNKLNISGFAYFVQGSQLIIKDSSIEGFVVNAPRAYIVGGAVGVVKSKCDMENVDVKAEFNIDYVDLIGGFAGQTQENGTGTTFTDCDVEVKMNLGNSGSDVGGFIAQTGAASQFYKCTATGSINVTNGTSALSVGGFVGNLGWNGMGAPNTQHKFNDCIADVDITAVNANVGGFIGDSTISGYPERFIPTYFNDCVAKGNVKTVNGVAGGFVGRGDRGIFTNCSASGNVEGRIAGGFWGEIYPKAKAEFSGGWSYQNKEVTHTDANAKSIVLDSVAATGAVEGTEYEAGIIGFMKDIYVNADETLGYATPIVLNETPDECNRYKYPAKKYEVSTKAELNAALAEAQEGEIILLTADIDYGTDQLKIEKAITLDLGGKTLTTRNAWGGMSVKNDPTIKNGTIVHASNTAAIKVWNATAFEDLIIDVQGKGDANKTIGGIVLQSGSTTNVGSIKNVTIKGEALTNGIQTDNCGDAAKNVIGSLEKVTIDAKGTGMLISAPVGTATNCSISGDVNGVEIWIKGNYNATLNLVNSSVEGGVYAHDEFSTDPDVVNNGTLTLTTDAATEIDEVTLTVNHAKEEQIGGILADVIETAQAKVNGTYYTNFAEAWNVANNGGTITLLQNYDTSILYVLNGVTLDLNGFILESDYVVVFNDGNIVDNSASNAGRLVVDSKRFMIEQNAQLPVKTESGYMFVTMEPVVEKWGQNGYYVAQFKIEAAAHELLKSNLAATGVSISIRVSWKNAAGLDRSQDFELPSAMLNEYLNTYKPNTGEYGGQIFLKLTNAPANTAIKYQVVIQSGNVEFTSNGYTK